LQSVEKWASRSDAWTPEDDQRLASLVLYHIQSGSTQLSAFDEAANELGRTSAACGYRWNGVVRKYYREEIEQAKQKRKLGKKSAVNEPAPNATGNETASHAEATAVNLMSIQDVISFLHSYDEEFHRLQNKTQHLEEDNQALTERIHLLEERISARHFPESSTGVEVNPQQLEEDSKTLFAIMERARKLLGEQTSKQSREA
jgi:hypothetical protein